MLDAIERHIREHAAQWGLALADSARLDALVRANPEHDGVVRDVGAGNTGTVIFWFRRGEAAPLLVAKIAGGSLSASAVRECDDWHRRANAAIGYELFPRVYDVVQRPEGPLIFMEAVDGPNYEVELARAVSGPERSSAAVRRIVARQLEELGKALRDLRQMRTGEGAQAWGEKAAAHAEDFFSLCPGTREVFGQARLARMRDLMDTVRLESHLVLTEDHVANYLPGPRAVDQLVSDLPGLCRAWPGPVDGLRLLISFYRASALPEAFRAFNWVDALAACALGPDEEVLGKATRGFLADIGLGDSRPEVLWAFVTGVFFLRGAQELRFHADNAEVAERLRGEFLDYCRRIAAVADTLASGASALPAAPSLDLFRLDADFSDRDAPGFMSPEGLFAERREKAPPAVVQGVRLALEPFPRLQWVARSTYRLIRWGARLGSR